MFKEISHGVFMFQNQIKSANELSPCSEESYQAPSSQGSFELERASSKFSFKSKGKIPIITLLNEEPSGFVQPLKKFSTYRNMNTHVSVDILLKNLTQQDCYDTISDTDPKLKPIVFGGKVSNNLGSPLQVISDVKSLSSQHIRSKLRQSKSMEVFVKDRLELFDSGQDNDDVSSVAAQEFIYQLIDIAK